MRTLLTLPTGLEKLQTTLDGIALALSNTFSFKSTILSNTHKLLEGFWNFLVRNVACFFWWRLQRFLNLSMTLFFSYVVAPAITESN